MIAIDAAHKIGAVSLEDKFVPRAAGHVPRHTRRHPGPRAGGGGERAFPRSTALRFTLPELKHTLLHERQGEAATSPTSARVQNDA